MLRLNIFQRALATPRGGILKFIDNAEKRGEQIRPAMFTSTVRFAWNTREVNQVIREAKRRFECPSWQLLAAAAHVSSGPKVDNPDLAGDLLLSIPKDDIKYVHEGVLRSVLGNASRHKNSRVALKAIDLLSQRPGITINFTDISRVIHSDPGQSFEKKLVDSALQRPCPSDLDFRAIGVFMKVAEKSYDFQTGQRVWEWSRPCWSARVAQDLVFVSIQYILLCARTGNLDVAKTVWNECCQFGLEASSELKGAMLSAFASNGASDDVAAFLDSYIPPSSINSRQLVSALTAFSHAGDTDRAATLVETIERIHPSVVTLEAYTALVDGYARKGEFKIALDIVHRMQKQGLEDDSVIWMTILGPCRYFKELDVGRQAFKKILEKGSEESRASAFVVMSDIYRVCGMDSEAEKLHVLRLESGLKKVRGAVTLCIGDKNYDFHVGAVPSELAHAETAIMKKLDEWAVWLAGKNVTTDSISCRHSEKLALAYAVLQRQNPVVMRKNLRICRDCHEASKHLTLLENIEIHHWDRSRLHLMKDGKCSCQDHY
jgi:pentatricopeptide repeat protein